MKKPLEKLIIYLADLDYFHPGNRASVPLGIGSIASYCRSIYGDAVDISLFKDPKELIKAVRRRPPHVLGCSFFMWNTNLTFKIIEACKIISRQTITLIGGPNVARKTDYFKKILKTHPSLDIVVLDQGEKSFANVLDIILKEKFNKKSIFSKSIDGCALRLNKNGQIKRGEIITGGIDINSFPSPYLEGYFDEFLRARFVPSFETVRGCPHHCTFCGGGVGSFLPLSVKDEATVYAELRYIFKHSKTKELDITDTNFGIMGERDLRISAFMLNSYKKTGFPRITGYATTKHKTKNSIKLMINMSRLTGSLYFALQTLSDDVLANCQRKNIPLETVKDLVAISKKNRWPIVVDLIFGLPGETAKSFMKTIDKILALGIGAPDAYQLRILRGTKIAGSDRKKYGYKTKFRPINGRYGEYKLIDGQKPVRIIEAEEIACQSNTFDFNDYLMIRNFVFLAKLLVNFGAFSDTVFYLFSRGIKITEVFKIIQKNYHQYPRLRVLFNSYKVYAKKELFGSEKRLVSQITKDDKQWNDLLFNRGNFFKLNLGFSGYCLFEDMNILNDFQDIIFKGIKNKLSVRDLEDFNEVARHDKLYRIVQDKKAGKLKKSDVKKEVIVDEMFDYEKWRAADFKGSIKAYRLKTPVKKVYYMEKFDLFNLKIDEYSDLSGYLFYEKILLWGPRSLKRLCRLAAN